MRTVIILACFASFVGSASLANPKRPPRPINSDASILKQSDLYQLPASAQLAALDLAMFAMKSHFYQRADQFSPPFNDQAILGRSFKIVLPVNGSVLSSPVWSYDYTKSELKLEAKVSGWNADEFAVDNSQITEFWTQVGLPTAVIFWKDRLMQDDEIEQNSFGAQVKIRNYFNLSAGVGSFSLSGYAGVMGRRQFEKTLHIEADKARVITKNMMLVIEGKVTNAFNHTLFCGATGHKPTLQEPINSVALNCVISTSINRVAFESPTGGVLAEWLPADEEQPKAKTPTPSAGSSLTVLDKSASAIAGPPSRTANASFGANLGNSWGAWGLPKGALVSWVTHDGVAHRAGIHWADTIIEWDGHRTTNAAELDAELAKAQTGALVPLKVLRGRETLELKAQF